MNRLWLWLGDCARCQRNLLRKKQIPAWDSHHKSIISPFPGVSVAVALAAGAAWACLGACCGADTLQGWCSGCSAAPHAPVMLDHFSAACATEPITLVVSQMGYGISGIPGWASCVLQHTLMCFCVEGFYFTLSSRHTVFLIATCKQIQAKLIPRSAGYFWRLNSSLAGCRAGHSAGHLNLC